MMFLDKIYLYIYWVVNKSLNQKSTTIWALNYLLFPILGGFLVFIFSLMLWLMSIKINLKFLIFIGLAISFFLSEKLIEKYYLDEKQKEIIENNKKPGAYRYIIFLFIVIASITLMIVFFFLAGIILHRPPIG